MYHYLCCLSSSSRCAISIPITTHPWKHTPMYTVMDIMAYLPREERYQGFLYENPSFVLAVVVAYLVFVLKLGPDFMRDRKPYNLRSIIRVYNLAQVSCHDTKLPTHIGAYVMYTCEYRDVYIEIHGISTIFFDTTRSIVYRVVCFCAFSCCSVRANCMIVIF